MWPILYTGQTNQCRLPALRRANMQIWMRAYGAGTRTALLEVNAADDVLLAHIPTGTHIAPLGDAAIAQNQEAVSNG